MGEEVRGEIVQENAQENIQEAVQADIREKKIKKKGKHNNFVFYLLAFLIPVVCIIIHMIIKECYPFGDNTILFGDSNAQFMGFYREWLNQIKNGSSFLFSWNGAMGYEFYTVYWYYLASPFNWLVLLFGQNHLELGMVFVFLLQVGGCGVTACYYFMHSKINKMKKSTVSSLICVLFATAYSMCDFILAYQYVMIWLISLMLTPIVLLGIERLVDNKDGRLYAVSLFLVLITNFYFAWFVCIFAVVWFIDQKKENIKAGLKSFGRFAGLSILSAACAAAVLIPCYLFVLNRNDNVSDITDYGLTIFGNIGDFFQGFFWGSDIDKKGSSIFTNNNYCGIFVIFLVLVYIFEKKIDVKQKIKRIIEIVILAFCMLSITTEYVLHGFKFAHGYGTRFGFILLFILIITAFEALPHIKSIRIRWIGAAAALFAGIVALGLLLNSNVQSIWCYMVTVMVFAYFTICLVLFKRKSIKRRSLFINILVIGFIEIIANTYMVNTDAYSTTMEKLINTDEWSDEYTDIVSESGERKTTLMSDSNCFWYSDTNIFSSVINSNILWFFEEVGLTYQSNGGSYEYRGTTPLTAALLNVDYVLTDKSAYFGGYELTESYKYDETEYGLYTTAYDAELGFILPETILEWDTDDENPLEVQNNFSSEVLNVGDIFTNIIFDDMTVDGVYCAVTQTSENSFDHLNICLDDNSFSGIEFSFTVSEDMHLYAYVEDSEMACIYFGVDGESILEGEYFTPGVLIDIGELKEGQEVVIDVLNDSSTLDEGTTYIDFYTNDDFIMQECLELMNENPLVIDTFEDTYVSGTVTADEDGVLYTSIPYYKGWTLYVDGEETEITKIADALAGVELTAGTHTIELKYFPYGLKAGIIITVIGLIGICIYFIGFRRKRKL